MLIIFNPIFIQASEAGAVGNGARGMDVDKPAHLSRKNSKKREKDESSEKSLVSRVSVLDRNDNKVKMAVEPDLVPDCVAKGRKRKKKERRTRKRMLTTRQKCVQRTRDCITRMWVHEEPHQHVERPFPSNSSRAHFCWYDAKQKWSDHGRPRPVAVENVDWNLKFGCTRYVHLPFADKQNKVSQGTSGGPRGELIEKALISFSRGVRDLNHLETRIRKYWSNFEAKALRKMFADLSTEEHSEYRQLLTAIARLALRAKQLVTTPLPTLTATGRVKSVSMSQEQAACLLAYSFFCTVLPRHNEYFNHFSFHFFHLNDSPIYIEKMKFILHYFTTVTACMPRGTLTYSRKEYDSKQDERLGFETWTDPLSNLLVTSDSRVDEMDGCLQVDYSHQYIGGDVMTTGAFEEEIRFLCCPEMMVSLLLCDIMDDNTAIVIQGAQQYNTYKGYSNTLRHVPMVVARNQRRDRFGRARTYVVAMDAAYYPDRSAQYEIRPITREIKKAYAGFMRRGKGSPGRPIATGNWGYGALGGDRQLKSLIQLIAASKADRFMIYCSYKDDKFAQELEDIVDFLHAFNVTNGQLYLSLIKYSRKKQQGESVFEFTRRDLT